MADEREIETKFWKALKEDRTLMLGLPDVEGGRAQPMTAQLDDWEDNTHPQAVYIFTAKDTDLAQDIGGGHRFVANFASKGHDLFATFDGEVRPFNDASTIERLWNPFVAAWFKGGKDDPNLLLLRLEPESAHIWLNENSLFAGIKLLLGRDPKKDYEGKTAEVSLS